MGAQPPCGILALRAGLRLAHPPLLRGGPQASAVDRPPPSGRVPPRRVAPGRRAPLEQELPAGLLRPPFRRAAVPHPPCLPVADGIGPLVPLPAGQGQRLLRLPHQRGHAGREEDGGVRLRRPRVHLLGLRGQRREGGAARLCRPGGRRGHRRAHTADSLLRGQLSPDDGLRRGARLRPVPGPPCHRLHGIPEQQPADGGVHHLLGRHVSRGVPGAVPVIRLSHRHPPAVRAHRQPLHRRPSAGPGPRRPRGAQGEDDQRDHLVGQPCERRPDRGVHR